MISGSEIRPGRAAIEFARAYGGKRGCDGSRFEHRVRGHRGGACEWRAGSR